MSLSTLQQVVYFRNGTDPRHARDFVMLAAYSEQSTPEGWVREYAASLSEIDRLQDRLREQLRIQCESEAQSSVELVRNQLQEIRDRLYTRMTSSSTSEYEREFIRCYLQLREERREKHRRNFECRAAYLWMTAHETPEGRGVNEEVFNAERHTVSD